MFIPKNVGNPYFDVAYAGGQKAATELGGTVSQVGPAKADPTAQIPFIQDATTQKKAPSPSPRTELTKWHRPSRPPWRRA